MSRALHPGMPLLLSSYPSLFRPFAAFRMLGVRARTRGERPGRWRASGERTSRCPSGASFASRFTHFPVDLHNPVALGPLAPCTTHRRRSSFVPSRRTRREVSFECRFGSVHAFDVLRKHGALRPALGQSHARPVHSAPHSAPIGERPQRRHRRSRQRGGRSPPAETDGSRCGRRHRGPSPGVHFARARRSRRERTGGEKVGREARHDEDGASRDDSDALRAESGAIAALLRCGVVIGALFRRPGRHLLPATSGAAAPTRALASPPSRQGKRGRRARRLMLFALFCYHSQ